MTSPDANASPPNPHPTTPAVDASPDATIEMERPKDLRKAALIPDATVEMERPKIQAPFLKPVPKAVSPDATIEMERPALPPRIAPAAPLVSPAPKLTTPDATLEMERPKDLMRPNLIPDATVEMDRPAELQPERRAAQRESGLHHVEVQKPLPSYTKKLGEVLIQMGKLSPEQVEEAVSWARESGDRLGRCLIRWGVITPDVICRALSIQTGMPMTVLEDPSVPEPLSKIFPLALMMHHGFVPFDQSHSVMCIAASNPLEPELLKELEKISKKVVEVFLAREDHVDRQLDWLRIKLKTRSRRNLRYSIKLSAAYQLCSRQGVRADKSIHVCKTVNVSEGGFLLDSPPPAVNDPTDAMRKGLYINLCIKWGEEEIWSICEVRELRLHNPDPTQSQLAPQQRWLLGVEIIDINLEFKKKLKELCKKASGKK